MSSSYFLVCQVSVTLPPSPRPLFAVDIPPDFIEEFEDHMNRQRVYWRGRAREARNQRLLEERSAAASLEESPSCLSGKVIPVAAGSGPRELNNNDPPAASLEGKRSACPVGQAVTVAAGSGPRRVSEVRFYLFLINNLTFALARRQVQILTSK